MKKLLTLLFFALLFTHITNAQEYFHAEAEKHIKGAAHIRYTNFSDIPDYVKLKPGNEIPLQSFTVWISKNLFENDRAITFTPIQSDKDELGFVHQRYQQHYNNIPVEGAVLIAHCINGRVVSFNGRLAGFSSPDYTTGLNEPAALDYALNHINATTYKWQLPEEEKYLKEMHGIDTYYPKGKLVWYVPDGDFKNITMLKAWKFDIYAHKPLYRADVFVDAATGAILFENNHIHTANSIGSATTGYSGTQTITTDSYNGSYRLRETTRGNGVQTFDMNTGTSYGNSVDFTDANNVWTNVNANLDQYATDAHWGLEKTYDYYLNAHARNSIDNNGLLLLAYIHYDVDYFNAFWDGTRMTFGDGDNNNPLVALDICAHELTHGVTERTAGLNYQNESGALNESFSDIFGAAIEFYTTPGQADWLMGEDIGSPFRSMSNPNTYGDPDTYHGTNWYGGTGDNGGVHTNSGVQNHWFYRLCQGGTGTNDIGSAYNVTGIGITDASKIAYRSLTTYLNSTSNYADARFYAIQAAIDLFGACTQQVISTTNAWYAVGVGSVFSATVTSDFSSQLTSACTAPFTASFTNLSGNAGTFTWDFGDGSATSTTTNPSHTYTVAGNYTVTLTASGGSCGNDVEVKTNYISINSANPCVAILPGTGTGQVQASCQGTMYDSGGPNADYADNTNVNMTITPAGATSVSIRFTSFNFESGYDYLYVYNGPTTASPLLGQYDGNTLPNNGNAITSTGGSITIRQSTDGGLVKSGFALDWTCVIPNSPPVVNFNATPTTSCSGAIVFADNSQPTPVSWLWDFGDGATSTQQNPAHTYVNDGTYTVTLTSTNTFGSNTLTRNALVVVDKPAPPAVTPGFRCDAGTVALRAAGLSGGTLTWYTTASGGSSLASGTSYATPSLNTSATYYVEEAIPAISQYVGPTTNAFGTGSVFNATQSQLFTAYTPFTLVSVLVYATNAGNRTIELRNSGGSVLQSTTVNVPNGTSRVTLNFSVPAGTDLQLGVTANANLYRNDSGPAYPYTIAGVVSITGSTAGTGYYYSFYDWEILTPACISERATVTATINTAPVTTGAARCDEGSLALSATGTADLNWYDAQTNGTLVNTGTNYTTPSLSNTTTYYVESNVVSPSLYVGPTDNNFGAGGNFTGTQHTKFDCTSNFTLVSVKVYASGAGNRIIQLKNSGGTVLQTATVNVPDGESRVTLNFPVTPGTQYQLGVSGTPNLYRNSASTVYPFTLPGIVSITGSSAGQPGYYYYFYDWEIKQQGCTTARTPVTATINNAPLTPVITNDGVNLSTTAANGYQWYLDGNLIQGANGQLYTPLEEGSYTVEITDANGCTSTSAGYEYLSTGINETAESLFKIYPNPNSGVFTLSCNENILDIVIYNALGELIEKVATNAVKNNYTIDISNVANGIYFVEARTAEKSFVKRVTVSR